MLSCSHSEEFFSYVQMYFPLKQLVPVTICSVKMHPDETSTSAFSRMRFFFFFFFKVSMIVTRSSEPFLLKPSSFNFFSYDVTQFSNNPGGPSLDPIQFFNVSLEMWGDQNWTEYSRHAVASAK